VLDELSVKIFADGADLDGILALSEHPHISGFTTNPTLMWKAGLTNYQEFAQRLLEQITAHPISFEVFADDADEMRRQARRIHSWGPNVYVKIPVTTTEGESMAPLVRELSEDGVQVNVTALFTTAQVELITAALKEGAPSYISVFAGRIADVVELADSLAVEILRRRKRLHEYRIGIHALLSEMAHDIAVLVERVAVVHRVRIGREILVLEPDRIRRRHEKRAPHVLNARPKYDIYH